MLKRSNIFDGEAVKGARRDTDGRMPSLDRLRASLRGFKSNFTRQLNASEALIRFAGTQKTAATALLVEKQLEDLHAAYCKLESAYEAVLANVADEAFDETDASATAAERKHREMRFALVESLNLITTAMATANVAAAPPGQGGGAATAAGPKVVDTLKPPKLLKESNTTEMRCWVQKFRTFFSASKLALATVEEQHAYMRVCLDPALEAKFGGQIPARHAYLRGGGMHRGDRAGIHQTVSSFNTSAGILQAGAAAGREFH